jgi:hypothetical protein
LAISGGGLAGGSRLWRLWRLQHGLIILLLLVFGNDVVVGVKVVEAVEDIDALP